jgi:hypothetical protein
MTEEEARRLAEVLASIKGATFYLIRSREGRCLPVELAFGDCEVLAAFEPPGGAQIIGKNAI